MRRVIISLLFLFVACSHDSSSQNSIPLPYDNQTESERITIYWSKAQTSEAEAKVILVRAAEFIGKASVLLGTKASHRHIFITLNGEGQMPGGELHPPYMDPEGGWVHLFRRTGTDYPYQNGISHELVHALRFEHIKKHDADKSTWYGFLEEGIAEYFSSLLEPTKKTFSVFGQGLTIAAGYWVINNQDIPLGKLVIGHDDLAQKCQVQAYPLRASFYQYLDEKYGRESFLRLAYWEQRVDLNAYAGIYGKSFEVLGQEWRSWISKIFLDTADSQKRANSYIGIISAKKRYVCKRDKDFS